MSIHPLSLTTASCQKKYTYSPKELQGWNIWISWTAIPLDNLSVKLMAPYTKAPVSCQIRNNNIRTFYVQYAEFKTLWFGRYPYIHEIVYKVR